MKIVRTLASSLMIILNSIELSSQYENSRNRAPSPLIPRRGLTFSLEEEHSPANNNPPAEPSRARSRSPPARNISTSATLIVSTEGHEYGLDNLEFIRITPLKNLSRSFQLRKYTFSVGSPIRICVRRGCFRPVPNQEKIVLSTLDGDIFAILDSTEDLSGIYAYNANVKRQVRIKMNIASDKITFLDSDEIWDVPVGLRRPILLNYRVESLKHNPPHH